MSPPSTPESPAALGPHTRAIQWPVVAFAAAALSGLALATGAMVSARQAALALLGAALGVALYHASFGFTSAYRRLLVERRGAGLRAQMLMLAIAVVLFFPVLGEGALLGAKVKGFVAPVGVAVLAGAAMFGVGMQLGGGCASGTLFSVGGGSPRMVLTLAFFVVGATVAAGHAKLWSALPSLEPVDLLASMGWPLALALHLALFALIAGASVVLELRAHGQLESARKGESWLRGPWPLVAGAVVLALGNFATLALSGKPWGVSGAFALWGSKVAGGLGVDVASWSAWSSPGAAKALGASVLADVASVMDFGIVGGALLATGLAGRFAPSFSIPWRSAAAAILGGLLLGYGARIAFGCNIGSFFSGVASGSVHGWAWIALALVGNAIGVWLRPAFGMPRR